MPKILRHRLILLVALLAVVGVSLVGPAQPAAIAWCVDAGTVTYYSDATYTTVTGSCHHACCQTWTCTGTLTNYSTQRMFSCDFS